MALTFFFNDNADDPPALRARRAWEHFIKYGDPAPLRGVLGDGAATSRISETGGITGYRPEENTEHSRWQAVKKAVGDMNKGDILVIGSGTSRIPNGQSLREHLPRGVTVFDVKVTFQSTDKSKLKYFPAEKSGEDSFMFFGERFVTNFGADPTRQTPSWNGFQSTLYSFPLYGYNPATDGPAHAPTAGAKTESRPGRGSSADDIFLRIGTGVIPQGEYLLEKPFYTQAYQTWRGEGSRTIILMGSNLAPSVGPEGLVPAMGVLRSVQSGNAQANFTHSAHYSGFVLTAAGTTGNTYLRAMTFHGAQNSSIREVGISNFAGGILVGDRSNFIILENLDIGSIDGRQPGVRLVNCNLVMGRNISVTDCNKFGTYNDGNGHYTAAFQLDGCFDCAFSGVLAESCVRNTAIYSCRNVRAHELEHTNFMSVSDLGITPLPGVVTADIFSSYNVEVSGTSRFVKSRVRVDSVAQIPGDSADYVAAVQIGFKYSTDNHISRLISNQQTFPGLNAGATWTRAGRIYKLVNSQGEENPALSLISTLPDGTDQQEVFNIAFANGGLDTGYFFKMKDVKSAGVVNTNVEYRVNNLAVVKDRGLAIPNASGGATVDAEARAAINALLAHFRTWGSIAT